jgi:hypothetical protein
MLNVHPNFIPILHIGATPGRSLTTEIPRFWSSAAGPIPLSFKSCGVLKAPPEIMSSFVAVADPLVLDPPLSELALYKEFPSRTGRQ